MPHNLVDRAIQIELRFSKVSDTIPNTAVTIDAHGLKIQRRLCGIFS